VYKDVQVKVLAENNGNKNVRITLNIRKIYVHDVPLFYTRRIIIEPVRNMTKNVAISAVNAG